MHKSRWLSAWWVVKSTTRSWRNKRSLTRMRLPRDYSSSWSKTNDWDCTLPRRNSSCSHTVWTSNPKTAASSNSCRQLVNFVLRIVRFHRNWCRATCKSTVFVNLNSSWSQRPSLWRSSWMNSSTLSSTPQPNLKNSNRITLRSCRTSRIGMFVRQGRWHPITSRRLVNWRTTMSIWDLKLASSSQTYQRWSDWKDRARSIMLGWRQYFSQRSSSRQSNWRKCRKR